MKCNYCCKEQHELFYNEIIDKFFCLQCRIFAEEEMINIIDSHSGEKYEQYRRLKNEHKEDYL